MPISQMEPITQDVPDDSIYEIISHMDIKDISNLSITNRKWHDICHRESIWIVLVKRDFDIPNDLIFGTWYNTYKYCHAIMKFSYSLIEEFSTLIISKYRNDKVMAKDIFNIIVPLTHRLYTCSLTSRDIEGVNWDGVNTSPIRNDIKIISIDITLIVSGLHENYICVNGSNRPNAINLWQICDHKINGSIEEFISEIVTDLSFTNMEHTSS